mgnify:CR=1 FL=1
MYKAALAAERAAYEQYQMAVDGAQTEDKASAASMVDAARSTVDEVSALLVDARLTAPEDGQIATIVTGDESTTLQNCYIVRLENEDIRVVDRKTLTLAESLK